MAPILKNGCARAPSTIRLLAYMAASGLAVGAVLYVSMVLGVTREPQPIHVTAQHFNFKRAV